MNRLMAFAIVLISALQLSATEYIVKLKKKGALGAAMHQVANMPDVSVTAVHSVGQLLKVDVQGSKTDEFKSVAQLVSRDDVEYVVENIKMHAFENIEEMGEASQWALEKVGAAKAWEITRGSKDVIVAVIDTGIDYKHRSLKDNIFINKKEIPGNGIDDDKNGFIDDVNGWDFKENNNNPMDATGQRNPGHGTHCAGIIGATGEDVSGINPHVSLVPLRFLGADGSGDLFASIKAIDYAIGLGVHVISASWGAAVPRSGAQPLIEAILRADQKGIIFVAAAANDGQSNDVKEVYPANAGTPNMISVAASDVNDEKPQWSNYGRKKVDLAAPGADILSTLPGHKSGKLSGTSMATPLVAGLVALLKSQDINMTGAQARSILQTTGAKVGIETACNCRIDAGAAVTAVQDKKLVVVPAAASLGVNDKLQMSAYGGAGSYSFESANPEVASVSAQGELVAKKEGDVKVVVKDAKGQSAQSLVIHVGQGGGSQEPPAEGKCPFPNEMMCVIACSIKPDLPWCKDMPGLPPPDDEEMSMLY